MARVLCIEGDDSTRALLRSLLEAGYPARALAYYRGGMHDWVTLAMQTEQLSD